MVLLLEPTFGCLSHTLISNHDKEKTEIEELGESQPICVAGLNYVVVVVVVAGRDGSFDRRRS